MGSLAAICVLVCTSRARRPGHSVPTMGHKLWAAQHVQSHNEVEAHSHPLAAALFLLFPAVPKTDQELKTHRLG